MAKQIDLAKTVGGGYEEFWLDRHPYRVVKGGRASKKSVTMALWLIVNIMKYPDANAVVVRNVYNTHKDSTFAELKKAASKLGVYSLWQFKESPYECVYKPTKQKILFRGFDDPMKLTSMTVPKGVLCWAWFEEAYEIESEADFDTFCEGLRGLEIEELGLWKQVTLTYNPWIDSHWTKTRFWDVDRPDTFRLTTTHKDNEFLSESDHLAIEMLQELNPERYRVVGLGEYGIPGGAYFDEFRESVHVCKPFEIPPYWERYRAIDYGLDCFAVVWIAVDERGNAYVYRELAEPNLPIKDAARAMREATRHENIRLTYGPHDMWSRAQETARAKADIFRENGVVLFRAGRDRVSGWLAMKEWLYPYKTLDEFTGEEITTAKLKIFSTCKTLIKNLPQLKRDEKKLDDVDPENGSAGHNKTHICDALRCFCVMRQRPAIQPIEKKPDYFRDTYGDRLEDTGEPDESYIYMQVRR